MMVNFYFFVEKMTFIKLFLVISLGDTCLQLAAYNNDLKLLELFIRSGANLDIQVRSIFFKNHFFSYIWIFF